MKHRFFAYIVLILVLGGCTSLPDNTNRTESFALADTQDTELGRFVSDLTASENGEDGFILLKSGLDAFVARTPRSAAEKQFQWR